MADATDKEESDDESGNYLGLALKVFAVIVVFNIIALIAAYFYYAK